MISIAMRACSRCGVDKPRDTENFLKIARSTDGLSYHCRECHKTYRRETKPTSNTNVTPIWQAWFDSQGIVADRITARHRRLRDPLGHAAKQMQKGLYGRTNGTDMFVAPQLRTVRYIRDWLKNDPFCECCGVEFDPFPENGAASDRSPSLDRFDLSIGYTLESTALVCWRCNNIKRNYVEADLRMVADWMEKRRSGQIKPIFAISWKSNNSENAA